jgi:short-subunit dehydrogenase involved in D-alanine esterification of teichoic acids
MTTLYIATHNKTGLKYFGKSSLYHTQEELQKCYHGSGVEWKNHLKEYGNDVIMEIWYQDENQEAINNLALMFSETYNIVKSDDWANMCNESGIGGTLGFRFSQEQKKTISIGKLKSNYNHSKETINQILETRKWYSHSKETKEKITKSKVGFTHSEETKEKIEKVI